MVTGVAGTGYDRLHTCGNARRGIGSEVQMAGGSSVADLKANAAKLAAASAPVLAAMAKAQPLVNPDTITSQTADAWSQEWQAIVQAVAAYLGSTLPSDVHAAITAATNAQQRSQTPAGTGRVPRPS
jgi:hypothetical protein